MRQRLMITLTRAQRVALKTIYNRGQRSRGTPNKGQAWQGTYREFRRTVIKHPDDCVMVPWCGMWLGIEKDGHTHS